MELQFCVDLFALFWKWKGFIKVDASWLMIHFSDIDKNIIFLIGLTSSTLIYITHSSTPSFILLKPVGPLVGKWTI